MYNFLFAKSNNGKFILRIEDTDQARLVLEAAQRLENTLKWAKIPPDESPISGGPVGPYVQSQRLDIYNSYIQQLLRNGSAYKCFCSSLRLKRLRNEMLSRNEPSRYDGRCRSLSDAKIERLERTETSYSVRLKVWLHHLITEVYELLPDPTHENNGYSYTAQQYETQRYIWHICISLMITEGCKETK